MKRLTREHTWAAGTVIAIARGTTFDTKSTSIEAWNTASSLASSHKVDALCGHWLRAVDRLPESAATFSGAAIAALYKTTASNLKLFANLRDLDAELQRAAIQALYLKGPWLAACAFPAGTRHIGDIDICIDESDYQAALRCLARLGYAAERTPPHDSARALYFAHYRSQLRFYDPDRFPLELHFRMINLGPPSVRESWVWNGARTFLAGSVPLRAPGPEAMLVHLLLHANQHSFSSLRLLHDIRWQLASDADKIDFDVVLQHISRLRMKPSAYFGLLLARELADAPVPAKWLEDLKPSTFRCNLFEQIWRLDRVRHLARRSRHSVIEAVIYYLLEMGHPAAKLNYMWGTASAPFRMGDRRSE